MSFLALNSYLEEMTEFRKSGRFEEIPFYILLGKLSSNKMSGRLVVSKGDRVKHVYFDRGNPVSIKSNLTAESLDSIVIRMGFLTQQRMLSVLKDIEKSNFLENLDFEQKLFLYFKERNLLGSEDLTLALKEQFSERLINLFGWFSGDFSFEEGSNLVYNLSSQSRPLTEILSEIDNILYPKKIPRPVTETASIHGNFKDTFFPTLMKVLIENRVTGKLLMQKKDRSKELRIHDGIPVSISSDHKNEGFSALMQRLGFVDRAKAKELEEDSRYLNSEIEAMALEKGILKDSELKLLRALVYTERFLELFSWRSGLYRFEKRKPVTCPNCKAQIQVKVDLNYKVYDCPKCGKKLSSSKPQDRTASEISLGDEKTGQKTVPTTDIRRVYGRVQEKVPPPKERVEEIKGEEPLDFECPDCKLPVDPVLKKCLNCADETLLDAYQMGKLNKPKAERSRPDFEKSKEKTDQKTEFDILVNNIMALSSERNIKTILITGVNGKTGTSFIALNTALYLSKNYKRRVLLIDANFKNPSLAGPLEVKPEYGLDDVLKKETDADQAVYETSYENLFLVPVKDKISRALIGSADFTEIIGFYKKGFDFIILDSDERPGSKTGLPLMDVCDGIIVVAQRGRTTQKEMAGFIAATAHSRKIIGTVLNRVR